MLLKELKEQGTQRQLSVEPGKASQKRGRWHRVLEDAAHQAEGPGTLQVEDRSLLAKTVEGWPAGAEIGAEGGAGS